MSSVVTSTCAGSPSRIATREGPWDSPAVSQRSMAPSFHSRPARPRRSPDGEIAEQRVAEQDAEQRAEEQERSERVRLLEQAAVPPDQRQQPGPAARTAGSPSRAQRVLRPARRRRARTRAAPRAGRRRSPCRRSATNHSTQNTARAATMPISPRTSASGSPVERPDDEAVGDRGQGRGDHHDPRQQPGAEVDDREQGADRREREQQHQQPVQPVAQPISAPAIPEIAAVSQRQPRQRAEVGVQLLGPSSSSTFWAGVSSAPSSGSGVGGGSGSRRITHGTSSPVPRRPRRPARRPRRRSSQRLEAGVAHPLQRRGQPVKIENCSAAWCTSRSSPLTSTRSPAAAASGVGHGS